MSPRRQLRHHSAPEGWDGQVPAGCGVPGCLPHPRPVYIFTGHGRCWGEGSSHDRARLSVLRRALRPDAVIAAWPRPLSPLPAVPQRPHRVAGTEAGRAWTVSRVRPAAPIDQSHAVRAVHGGEPMTNMTQTKTPAARARAVEQYAP